MMGWDPNKIILLKTDTHTPCEEDLIECEAKRGSVLSPR